MHAHRAVTSTRTANNLQRTAYSRTAHAIQRRFLCQLVHLTLLIPPPPLPIMTPALWWTVKWKMRHKNVNTRPPPSPSPQHSPSPPLIPCACSIAGGEGGIYRPLFWPGRSAAVEILLIRASETDARVCNGIVACMSCAFSFRRAPRIRCFEAIDRDLRQRGRLSG